MTMFWDCRYRQQHGVCVCVHAVDVRYSRTCVFECSVLHRGEGPYKSLAATDQLSCVDRGEPCPAFSSTCSVVCPKLFLLKG